MAATGLALFLFAVVHMIGNLQLFLGPEALNRYAHFLQSNPDLLGRSRAILFAAVVVHILTSINMRIKHRMARPQGYRVKELVGASWASRTMIVTGGLLAVYVVYHIMQFTTGSIDPNLMTLVEPVTGHHDVYRMVVIGFSNPLNSAGYILAMGFLCLHLSHGVGAAFHSLGLKNQLYEARIKRCSHAVACLLFVGYSIAPLSIVLGWVK